MGVCYGKGGTTLMPLRIATTRVEPDIVVLQPSGRITLGPQIKSLEALVRDLLRKNEKKLILDLTEVEFIDSTGTMVITDCFFAVKRAHGELRLASARERVRRPFQIKLLDAVIPFYPTVAEACEGFTITPGG